MDTWPESWPTKAAYTLCDLCAQKIKAAKPGQIIELCPGCSKASRNWMGTVKRVVGTPAKDQP